MHPAASGERVVEVRWASQVSSAMGGERVVEGLRRSWCITNEVLRENWRRSPEKGVMHRVRVGVYSGMLRVRMWQRNLGLRADAGLVGGYLRLRSGNGSAELLRSGEGGVGGAERVRATPRSTLERRVWDLSGWYYGPLGCFSCRAQPFQFLL